jgi:hypothetical protein
MTWNVKGIDNPPKSIDNNRMFFGFAKGSNPDLVVIGILYVYVYLYISLIKIGL